MNFWTDLRGDWQELRDCGTEAAVMTLIFLLRCLLILISPLVYLYRHVRPRTT